MDVQSDGSNPQRTYDALLEHLKKYVAEEIKTTSALAQDEDTFCPARILRRARVQAFYDVALVLDVMDDWEWL